MVFINSGGSPDSGTAAEEANPPRTPIADDGSARTTIGDK